ncbi:hypothetical protein [Hephaestia caeni]|uniref:hypothetical protein n=1 Tax=Hephaestia caeni TaxID=645617 RepID=UPI0011C4AA02|nr:hypothetical protein [Hephaestia caeni]
MNCGDDELIRELAKFQLHTLAELRQLIWEQSTSSYKWLNASLLAVNGGAALSIISSEEFSYTSREGAVVAFLAGILFALLGARIGQHFAHKSIPHVQEFSAYWLRVAVRGERDEDIENEIHGQMQQSARFGWTAQACGWVSIVAFVIGVLVAGFGLK